MGKSSRETHKKRRHKHSSSRRSSKPPNSPGPVESSKLLRYASLGKARKLRSLLSTTTDAGGGGGGGGTAALLNSVADASGATALHQAARHGHLEVVQMLLRRGADPSLCDAAGNSPAHLAAMHGHLLVLTELVKAADIDLDRPNAAGFSVRQILQQQQQAGDGAGAAASSQDTGSSSSSMASEEAAAAGGSQYAGAAAAGAAAAAAGPAAGAGSARSGLHAADAAEADDWLDKLAYEMSYDDGGGWQSAWGDAMAAAAAAAGSESPPGRGRPSAATASSRAHKQQAAASAHLHSGLDGANGDDDDDAWADRLWQDMQEHRRKTAAAKAAAAAAAARSNGSTRGYGPSSREEAAKERERKAAAAAAESARILKEEQAKDADWRQAMMRQVEEAALPMRQATYEQRWQQLAAWPADKPIRYQDIPWPCPVPGSQAAAARRQQQQPQGPQALLLDPKQLQALVLAGAKSAADVKLALRKELMRWHPDKFTARYGARLDPADKEAIQAGVHAVAQQLTALKQQ